jgi:hypothetical protein
MNIPMCFPHDLPLKPSIFSGKNIPTFSDPSGRRLYEDGLQRMERLEAKPLTGKW